MISSIIKFGVRQTEAVAVGAVRFGLQVARTVVGVVIDATSGGRFDVTPEPAAPEPRPEPSPTRPPAAVEQSDVAADDPERERRIELRDQPSEREDPHHALNNPVTDDPDPTEWPDPYDQREDPRDPDTDELVLPGEVPHTPTGSHSTSSPHPSQDPQAERWNGPKRSASGE